MGDRSYFPVIVDSKCAWETITSHEWSTWNPLAPKWSAEETRFSCDVSTWQYSKIGSEFLCQKMAVTLNHELVLQFTLQFMCELTGQKRQVQSLSLVRDFLCSEINVWIWILLLCILSGVSFLSFLTAWKVVNLCWLVKTFVKTALNQAQN